VTAKTWTRSKNSSVAVTGGVAPGPRSRSRSGRWELGSWSRLLRRTPDGALSEYADVAEHCAGHLNDMVAGPDGTLYVGKFGFDLVGLADAEYTALIRVTPGGQVVETVALPDGLGAFACMLGGEDGKTLLMCAAPDFAEANRKAAREAVLVTTTVDVPAA
jgi:sugar lactone lactonase YvrE